MVSNTCIAPGHNLKVSSVYYSCNQLQTKKRLIKRSFVTVTGSPELSMCRYGPPVSLILPGSLPHGLMLKICKRWLRSCYWDLYLCARSRFDMPR